LVIINLYWTYRSNYSCCSCYNYNSYFTWRCNYLETYQRKGGR